MNGLVDYADDSSDVSSDGEIVVGGQTHTAAKSAPNRPARSTAKPAQLGTKHAAAISTQAASVSSQADGSPTTKQAAASVSKETVQQGGPQPAQYAVPAALAARFEHFTQLTMQGNDLVDALQGRMLGPSCTAQTADHSTYSSALPAGAWAHPPDFRSLLQQGEAEEKELVALRSTFPHAVSASSHMHTSGAHS